MHDFRAMSKYFGRKAAEYDEKRASKQSTQRDQVTVEDYLAKIPPGGSVLDIPAGTGRFIEFCIGRGLVYTGVDISQDMLELARTKIPTGVTSVNLRVADARALPFENDAFDYAIVIKFIKWLPTLEILIDVLREIGRVTRTEALVQISVSQTSCLPLATRAGELVRKVPLVGAAFAGRANGAAVPTGGSRAYSEQELADAIFAAGLHIRRIMPERPLKNRQRPQKHRTVRNFYLLSKDLVASTSALQCDPTFD